MLNRLNLNRHFSLKITLPVILLLMIAVSVLVGVALYNQDAMLLSQEESRLKSLVNSFNSENDLHGKMALSLATSIANMPEVQNRFETGDRQGLLDYLKNLYQSLHTEFNVEQAQFHLAPATSFLRLNKPEKFGDDLSTFRFMVVAANKEHKAFYGLEFGVTGSGIRGVTPVMKDGKTLGSFEIGINFDKTLLETFKKTSGAEYNLLMPDPKNANLFQGYASTLEKPLSISNETRQKVFNGSGSVVTLTNDENGLPYAVITAPVRDYSQNIVSLVEIAYPRADTLAVINQNQIIMALLGIAILLITGFLMIVIINRLTRPLKSMQRTAAEIAQYDLAELIATTQAISNGDLTVQLSIQSHPLPVTSQDEIGALQNTFNTVIESLQQTGIHFEQMTERLRLLIGHVASQTENVAASSEQLTANTRDSDKATEQMRLTLQNLIQDIIRQSETITDTADLVNQMARTVTDVAHGSQEQALAVNQATDATSQMAHLINEITTKAQSGDQLGVHAGKTAQEGAESVRASLATMQRIHTQVDLSSQKVKVMGQRSSQIGTIVETIEEIAAQTNLLALNAAIEAARAGEYGKGFSVVADEVRKLAEKSTASTKEIIKLIHDIQTSANEAIEAMELSAREVEQGVERSNESATALQSILSAVNQVTYQVKEIAVSAEQMSQASSTVSASMESVSAVVEENTAATEEMSDGAKTVSQAMKQAAQLSQDTSLNMHAMDKVTAELSNQSNDVLQAAQDLAELAQNLEKQILQFKFHK